MADKKLNQLTQAGTLTINDIIGLCQNLSTGEMVYESLGVLKTFILGGANAGARIYFVSGAPSDLLGVDNDLVIDTQGKNFYFKESGTWDLKDNYGVPDIGIGKIRFTSVLGSGGLAPDGLTYQNDDLTGGNVTDVRVEVNPLISVVEWGDTPAFDEFDFDEATGTITFGEPLPAGVRITILYSF